MAIYILNYVHSGRGRMKTIGVKQLRDNLSCILKSVENGAVIRVLRHGKDIVELRPIIKSLEQKLTNRLRDKELLGGGTGKIGAVKTVRNVRPEMPVSDLVIQDRR
jgi:antitoxin (DNA-binding transcriptional repressor) of toxin-antitoxin stability system